MGDALNASILFFMRRTRRSAVPQEPADLGTAFGLEMSLNEPAEPATTAPHRPLTWLERLGLKSR